MISNNTYYERNKERLQENHNEIQIELYQKNNNEIWDERLNGKTVVTKMFLITKIKLYADEMQKNLQLFLSYRFCL